MKTIDSFNFSGKKALIRVDFNVPLNGNYQITDDTRINAAIPTIKKILDDGGAVILMSHLGRPKQGPEERFSLKHLVKDIMTKLNATVKFADDCIGASARKLVEDLNSGEVLLLENTRFYKEETAGDPVFAKKLAGLADVYVNDAFGTAHRAHASTTIVADYFDSTHKMFGYLMECEIKNADKVLHKAEKPFTAILGGAKVSDKIMLIENLLSKVDNIIIGGGMAYTFCKAKGGRIGNSIVEEDKMELANSILAKAKIQGVNFLLPRDSVSADKFSEDSNVRIMNSMEIEEGWMGLDIGDEAVQDYIAVIKYSKTILWNGPMGVFEMNKFQYGTAAIAKSVADATQNGAFSMIGGGDSVAAINKFGLQDKISFISTGGGAMLEYFEGKELPGIKAIVNP